MIKQLSAANLAVEPARAATIRRMVGRLPPAAFRKDKVGKAAADLAKEIAGWKTRAGQPLKPTSRFNMTTALGAGVGFLFPDVLRATPLWKRQIRGLKKELGQHVRRQAPPISQEELRRTTRDTRFDPHVRLALRFAWSFALRLGSVRRVLCRDVLREEVSRDGGPPIFLVRFRGLKGHGPGDIGYYRFLPCVGLAAPLARFLRRAKTRDPNEPLFQHFSPRRGVRAMRRATGRAELQGHSVRRGVATHLADKGVPTVKIQTILAHKKIESTRLYVEPRAAQRDHRKFLRTTLRALLLSGRRRRHN